jgi:hypothetical protein
LLAVAAHDLELHAGHELTELLHHLGLELGYREVLDALLHAGSAG